MSDYDPTNPDRPPASDRTRIYTGPVAPGPAPEPPRSPRERDWSQAQRFAVGAVVGVILVAIVVFVAFALTGDGGGADDPTLSTSSSSSTTASTSASTSAPTEAPTSPPTSPPTEPPTVPSTAPPITITLLPPPT